MHLRATWCLILGFAGLLCGTVEEVFAAEDLSEKNNLTVTRPTRPRFPDDVFSRMFPGLPSFVPQTDEAREKAKELGKLGGVIDAKDVLSLGPVLSITDPANASPNNPDNMDNKVPPPKINITAGVTFFGQFLDHDLTLALKAPLLERTEPR